MTTITLHRVAPDQHMWRFYRLETAKDLFGVWCLTREWGRIGRPGQCAMASFPSAEVAERALERQRRSKERRGYRAA